MSEEITHNNNNNNESTKKSSSRKLKFDRNLKLPTPPPDPWENPNINLNLNAPKSPSNSLKTKNENASEENKCKENSENSPSTDITEQDKEMFDYIESLHRRASYSRSTSTFVPAIITEEAFDHLDKLYKLMEQMLLLREQNIKLHRKIRDLEQLNNLEKSSSINKNSINNDEIVDEDYPDMEKDTAFAEAVLNSILQDPKNKDLPKYNRNPRNSLLHPRRGSATDKQLFESTPSSSSNPGTKENKDKLLLSEIRKSCEKSSSKVSKWTKVKAAFKWEKVSSTVGESKSQDSGIHVPVNYELIRYLRVPSTSDDLQAHSPGDSGAGISTPATISSASSNDDLNDMKMNRLQCEDLRSSDDEINPHHYIPQIKKKSHGHKYHLTPWAKMRDIIQTKNSFKKKHRLSAASEDIQIDVELCSDNEEVFEAEYSGNKSMQVSLSPSPNVYSNSSTSPSCGSDIPPDIVERYQMTFTEDNTSDSDVKSSRWDRVRRAFLSPDYQQYKSRKALRASYKQTQKLEDFNIEDEIQKNYKKLQKKLSLEFQEKMSEWEKLKQNNSPTNSPTLGISEDCRDPFYMKKMEDLKKAKGQSPVDRRIQMTREYELPQDFKKKLQEWEKIKKTSQSNKKKIGEIPKWKSLGGPRSSDHSPVFEYPVLTDDFRKKLEEWKQIKALGGPTVYSEQKKLQDKTPSPKLSRKNSSPKQRKKSKDNSSRGELHWFEKELGKIEKEKLRLERERQKFIEREERLSKLRKSILGVAPAKKEILIHTPSGFHRFEGISRKFTQKLYEWEKSQGIAPEASTFALLSASNFTPNIRSHNSKIKENLALPRSKSADSIAISALNLTCPLLSGHPSSLSLNDMEELEQECMGDSKSSSMRDILLDDNYLDQNLDVDEPEAVLVEVEDYEEEATKPLRISCTDRQQLPVYQHQEFKPLCESETLIVPKIRRSESSRAQLSYDLIEKIGKLLNELQITDNEIRNIITKKHEEKPVKFLIELQTQSTQKLLELLLKLKEANDNVIVALNKEEINNIKLLETLDQIQKISSEMIDIGTFFNTVYKNEDFQMDQTIIPELKNLRLKITELRCMLSCLPSLDNDSKRKKLNDFKSVNFNDTKESEKDKRYVKMEAAFSPSTTSQGAVKKRIKHKQKVSTQFIMDSDDEGLDSSLLQKNLRQSKKLTRTRSVSEGECTKNITKNIEKTHVETTPSDSAVTLFVKTTRKLFTPIVETLGKSLTEPNISVNSEDYIAETANSTEKSTTTTFNKENIAQAKNPFPPLPPPSPIPQRKVYKEVSPNIKFLMAKYNQNIGQTPGLKSGGSSGSNSPIAWRSPVSERRVKIQTEKYQEELNKLSPLLGERHPVQKSSSSNLLSSFQKSATIIEKNSDINKFSTSQEACNSNYFFKDIKGIKRNLTLDLSLPTVARSNLDGKKNFSPEMRMRKMQKVKEDFLNTPPLSAPVGVTEKGLQFPKRDRLSQISVENDSDKDMEIVPYSLIKSASAGMINVDLDVYKRIDPEYRSEGYVSLPRQTNAKKGNSRSKSAFSSIASKFRKVKMRKGKDKEKDKQVVEVLCRQSLVVNIDNNNEEGNENRIIEDNSRNNNGNLNAENLNDRSISPSSIFKSFFKK